MSAIRNFVSRPVQSNHSEQGKTMSSNRKQDPRSWWHEEAKQMKRDGHTCVEIAKKFDKHPQTITYVTKGVKRGKRRVPEKLASPHRKAHTKRFIKDVGFAASDMRDQIALRLAKPLMARVNLVAKMENKSVNSMIHELIEEALSFEGPKPRPIVEHENYAH